MDEIQVVKIRLGQMWPLFYPTGLSSGCMGQLMRLPKSNYNGFI